MSSDFNTTSLTNSQIVRKNSMLLVASMLVTFALLRVFLHISPNTDLNIGSYNIHHLFTGLLLIAAGGLPLAISHGTADRNKLALIIFGIGLGMALDEWVFLIATDGSNYSYNLPVSFWGSVVVVGLACFYTGCLMWAKRP
jgi:hypothetical protein